MDPTYVLQRNLYYKTYTNRIGGLVIILFYDRRRESNNIRLIGGVTVYLSGVCFAVRNTSKYNTLRIHFLPRRTPFFPLPGQQ